MTETPQTEDPMIAALLREREGYVGREGKEDRVAAVDEQLKLRGYKAPRRGQPKPAEPKAAEQKDGKQEEKTPQTEAPQGRQAPAKSET